MYALNSNQNLSAQHQTQRPLTKASQTKMNIVAFNQYIDLDLSLQH